MINYHCIYCLYNICVRAKSLIINYFNRSIYVTTKTTAAIKTKLVHGSPALTIRYIWEHELGFKHNIFSLIMRRLHHSPYMDLDCDVIVIDPSSMLMRLDRCLY